MGKQTAGKIVQNASQEQIAGTLATACHVNQFENYGEYIQAFHNAKLQTTRLVDSATWHSKKLANLHKHSAEAGADVVMTWKLLLSEAVESAVDRKRAAASGDRTGVVQTDEGCERTAGPADRTKDLDNSHAAGKENAGGAGQAAAAAAPVHVSEDADLRAGIQQIDCAGVLTVTFSPNGNLKISGSFHILEMPENLWSIACMFGRMVKAGNLRVREKFNDFGLMPDTVGMLRPQVLDQLGTHASYQALYMRHMEELTAAVVVIVRNELSSISAETIVQTVKAAGANRNLDCRLCCSVAPTPHILGRS